MRNHRHSDNHHNQAAYHYDQAAEHHNLASRYHNAGNKHEAAYHAHAAQGHAAHAQTFANRASKQHADETTHQDESHQWENMGPSGYGRGQDIEKSSQAGPRGKDLRGEVHRHPADFSTNSKYASGKYTRSSGSQNDNAFSGPANDWEDDTEENGSEENISGGGPRGRREATAAHPVKRGRKPGTQKRTGKIAKSAAKRAAVAHKRAS